MAQAKHLVNHRNQLMCPHAMGSHPVSGKGVPVSCKMRLRRVESALEVSARPVARCRSVCTSSSSSSWLMPRRAFKWWKSISSSGCAVSLTSCMQPAPPCDIAKTSKHKSGMHQGMCFARPSGRRIQSAHFGCAVPLTSCAQSKPALTYLLCNSYGYLSCQATCMTSNFLNDSSSWLMPRRAFRWWKSISSSGALYPSHPACSVLAFVMQNLLAF